MNYKQTVKYLYNVVPSFQKVGTAGYKEGLSNTLALDEHFGHPHRNFKTIHVAGTNGKGSCSHTLAAMLQSMGLKVGLYTSPHLVDFRERIRVNGKCISKKRVVDFVKNEHEFFEPLYPSFFELTTALAFKYFAEKKVDIAVVEVGLGGRLDCTNIIMPELCIITNISFDHTQFLGNTLEEIAAEKAGIIKPGVPVVIGETTPETTPVFERKAAEKQAPLYFAEEGLCTPDISEKVKELLPCFELKGSYQEKNLHTILTAAKLLGIPDKAVEEGLRNVCEMTGLQGRWQTLQKNPLVICDAGHNVGGWQYVSKQIAELPCKQLRIVFGMVDDKDIDTVMNMLPQNAIYYWTQASTKRAIPALKVKEKGEAHQLKGTIYDKVVDAYKAALGESGNEDFIFVGGSSYIVSDLFEYLNF
ncbi:MAG: bifunctional folylpolyglutamate synthase/dihydrofolate synthase [Prevotella sp.]|nr:bifunctional folylpolyglutamate synthase/dihydrofolate synthase [Prevotella sp.]